jgi:hypothetical protein
VFIDETGPSTKMARLRGRAKRGQRCRAAVPHGHWQTATFTGALRLHGMTAPMVLDGPMNRAAFQAYIEQLVNHPDPSYLCLPRFDLSKTRCSYYADRVLLVAITKEGLFCNVSHKLIETEEVSLIHLSVKVPS